MSADGVPVLWEIVGRDGHYVSSYRTSADADGYLRHLTERADLYHDQPYRVIPLYAHPAATAREEALARSLLAQAAAEVCMYCGKRANPCEPGWHEVHGPNAAGNYVHQHPTRKDEPVLCAATAIHSRLMNLTRTGADANTVCPKCLCVHSARVMCPMPPCSHPAATPQAGSYDSGWGVDEALDALRESIAALSRPVRP